MLCWQMRRLYHLVLVAFGPGETIVGDGRLMSATETGIAEDNAADIADVGKAEEVVGVAVISP